METSESGADCGAGTGGDACDPAAAQATSDDPAQPVLRMVLVTGPSGAGRSTAIHALEDLGYEPIDNLPLSLVPRLLEGHDLVRPVALGIDVRNRDFSAAALIEAIDQMTRDPRVEAEVLFLDCRPEELVRRYGETRRRHPLAPTDIAGGIAAEMDLLAPIKARANVLIDTSELTVHELKAEIARWFETGAGAAGRIGISVQSFSYKRGVPRGIDIMFDCRFLKNPHWNPELRPRDGRDPEVADFVASDSRFADFFARLLDLALFVLPAHVEEGRSHLTIGLGCTGGQHRSVAVAEKLAAALAQSGWQVSKRHRELERRATSGVGQPSGVSKA